MIFLWILFPVLFLNHSYNENPSEIKWTASKLSISDFKQKPPGSSAFAALTTSSIHMNTNIDENGKFTFTVYCGFIPNQSWMKVKTDYILNHEQKHFDLSEVFTRKLKHDLDSLPANSNFKLIPQKLFTIENNACQLLQKKYDDETNHSVDATMQAIWNERIDSLLNVNLQ